MSAIKDFKFRDCIEATNTGSDNLCRNSFWFRDNPNLEPTAYPFNFRDIAEDLPTVYDCESGEFWESPDGEFWESPDGEFWEAP